MSRIDEMIQELRPDGVVFQELGDSGTVFGGLTGKSKADFSNGNARYVSYMNVFSNAAVDVEANDFVKIESGERQRMLKHGDVIFTGSSESADEVGMVSVVTAKVNEPLYLNSFCIGFRPNDPDLLDPEFSKHLFRSSQMRSQIIKTANGVTRFNVSKARLAKVRVPMPPLEVQREIVKVLDQFTQLEAGLEAELEAELEARHAQRAWYWKALLSPREDWQTVTLGDIADVFDGPHATPKKTADGPWYLSISSLKNGRFDLAESAHLGDDQYPDWTRRVTPQFGDTMFSYETRLGQAAFWDRNEPAALGRRMGLLRPKQGELVPRFLTLLYLGPQFQDEIKKRTVRGSTVDRIPIAAMASWPVSLPSTAEQRRIVALLDTFDVLANDLAIGLPAELSARRKQYEYYRDRLLTFKEAAA
ncbi:type I restriction enzyme, S subunit [Streptomyces sp. TLI_053]|uniref:restriction endonuclease subunit S n=1 Tax=Streptomyces sp. TLI_053 TaxID=1855352 RepID=UPI00087C07BC|nr:restriction endonuclease subunit S [Streptomyces sp. TLI_053]SDT68900.1 type I restriction enzyme, S subunit [Streptomyces sp. TLI_053]